MSSIFGRRKSANGQIFPLLLISVTLFTTGYGMCYAPNGTAQVDDEGAQPCSSDPTNPLHTICCHTNWKNPPGADLKYGSTRDECLPNGLCQNRGFSTEEGKEQEPYIRYYRVYCTNRDWDTGECLDVCSTEDNAGVTAQITPCDGTNSSTTWCCGNSTACCTPSFNPDAVEINRVFRGVTNLTISSTSSSVTSHSSTSSHASSPTSKPSSAPTTTSTRSSTPTSESSDKLSGGAIGGISIAAIAGAAAMFGLGFLIARRRSTVPKQRLEDDIHELKGESIQSKVAYSHFYTPHELETNGPVPEVSGEGSMPHRQ